MYLPEEFRPQIAGYLDEIKSGSNVKKVLTKCARELFGYAEQQSKGFLSKMYEQATKIITILE